MTALNQRRREAIEEFMAKYCTGSGTDCPVPHEAIEALFAAVEQKRPDPIHDPDYNPDDVPEQGEPPTDLPMRTYVCVRCGKPQQTSADLGPADGMCPRCRKENMDAIANGTESYSDLDNPDANAQTMRDNLSIEDHRDPYFVLAFCEGAIEDAIGIGLDHGAGKHVLTLIRACVKARDTVRALEDRSDWHRRIATNVFDIDGYDALDEDGQQWCRDMAVWASQRVDEALRAAALSKAPDFELVDEFFMRLSYLASAKDVAANGPNEETHWRSLHAVPLTMNEILKVKATLYARVTRG